MNLFVDLKSKDYEHWSFNFGKLKKYINKQDLIIIPNHQIEVLKKFSYFSEIHFINSNNFFKNYISIYKHLFRLKSNITILNENFYDLILISILTFFSKIDVKIYIHNEVFSEINSLRSLVKVCLFRIIFRYFIYRKINLICSSREFFLLFNKKFNKKKFKKVFHEDYSLISENDWYRLASFSNLNTKYYCSFIGAATSQRGVQKFFELAIQNPAKNFCLSTIRNKLDKISNNISVIRYPNPFDYSKILVNSEYIFLEYNSYTYRLGTSGVLADLISLNKKVVIGKINYAIERRLLLFNINYIKFIKDYEIKNIIRDGKYGDHVISYNYLDFDNLENYFYFKRKSKFYIDEIKKCLDIEHDVNSIFSLKFINLLRKNDTKIYWFTHPFPNKIYVIILIILNIFFDDKFVLLNKNRYQYIRNNKKKIISNISSKNVLIFPTSSESSKDLDIKYLDKIIKFINNKYPNYYLYLCSDKKLPFEDSVNIINISGKTKFIDIFNLIKSSELVISVDSAPAHIAALLSKKAIIIQSGKNKLSYWYPLNNNIYNLRNDNIHCFGCMDRFCKYNDNYCINNDKILNELCYKIQDILH